MTDASNLPNGISDLEKALARQHMGNFAWPTLLLAISVFILFLFTCYQCFQGNWPIWLGFIINTVLGYISFTPQHDAMHGSISGVKGQARNITRLDHLVGWMCTVVLSLPFTYRVLHLKHHSHTNDPEKDIDFYAHSKNAFHALTAPYRQAYHGYFIAKAMFEKPYYRKQAGFTLLWLGFQLLLISIAVYFGYALEVFMVWFIPGLLAISIVSMLFQWLPHHPHTETGRYTNTRVTLFPGGTIFLLGQNTHLIHHMFPRIPFYRYYTVFKQLRPELERRGSKIEGSDW